MPVKEVCNDGIRIDDVCGNCLVSVATCALDYLGRKKWDPKILRNLLPVTSDYYLEILLKFLENDTGLKFEGSWLRDESSGVARCIMSRLDEGSLCKFSVYAQKWVGEIVGVDASRIGLNENHAILILGYYAPEETEEPLWLYVADPYSEKLLFVPFDQIFGILYRGEKGWVPIGIFCRTNDEKFGSPSLIEDLKMLRTKEGRKNMFVRRRVEKKKKELFRNGSR